jgi:hypothetical protein
MNADWSETSATFDRPAAFSVADDAAEDSLRDLRAQFVEPVEHGHNAGA